MKHTYKKFSKDQSEAMAIIAMRSMMDGEDLKLDEERMPFAAQIILKRIETLKLPIEFTHPALATAACLVEIPGEAVLLLIDCLNKHEGKKVTSSLLTMKMYPWGFYDQPTFEHIIDNEIKTGKMKWAEIY